LALHCYSSAEVGSAFYPLWDDRMTMSFRAEYILSGSCGCRW